MTDVRNTIEELAQEALHNYEQALQAGLSVQQELGRTWTAFMSMTTAPDKWMTQWREAMAEMVPVAQKRVQESIQLFEERSLAGLGLLVQAIRAGDADRAKAEQEELQRLLKDSLAGFRKGSEAMIQFNAKAIECWSQLIGAGDQPRVKKDNSKK